MYKGKIKVKPLEYNVNERMIMPKGTSWSHVRRHVSRAFAKEKAATIIP